MAIRDLIPFSRGRDIAVRRGEDVNPFLTLHREMNRLFDDVFRGFDLAPFGSDRFFDRAMGWPNIEVSETDREVKVTAELPGLEEKDVQVEFANGTLAIKGEKNSETGTGTGCSASAITAASSGASRSRTWTRTRCPPRSRTACSP
jgi:HSP20 family protein